MIGKTVSHYRIVEKLGEGGMGVVYRAQDTRLGRTVALKFLPAELTRDPQAKERFIQEARAASALDHPNICTIHEIDETGDGGLFICMSFYSGQTLEDKIAKGPLPIEDAVAFAAQIARGLAKAQERGIIHRDIKPANVFVTTDHEVKILDFGLAKLAGQKQLTRAGETMGTAAYMSPEQASGGETDHRTDIWAVGVVLYEMLSGKRPFSGEHEPALIYAIMNNDPPPLAAPLTAVPAGLEGIVGKCLAKSPQDRYQSAGELLADLNRWAGATTAPATGNSHEAGRAASRRKSAGLRIGLGIIVLLALAGVYAIYSRLSAPGAGTTVPERKMLVVLPFANLGPPENEYFTDGITEEITSRLAALGGLGVISRTSAFQYKTAGKPIKVIGEELGVDYVLEGTVRWDIPGEGQARVRVTPQLIRVADDTHIWTDRYERVLRDIFTVQSEIAARVVGELNVTLIDPEREALRAQPTANMDAYQAYLRGRDYLGRLGMSVEHLRLAIQMFQRAVELDPKFALAYAALGRAHSMMFNLGMDRTRERVLKTKAAVDRALELNPELPEANLALGYYYYHCLRDYDKALDSFNTAAKRLPNGDEVLQHIGWIRRRQGRWEEALDCLERSVALNPRDPNLLYEIGNTYLWIRRYGKAQDYYERSIALAPDEAFTYAFEALTFWLKSGDLANARRTLERMPDNDEPIVEYIWCLQEILEGKYRAALDRLSSIPVEIIELPDASVTKAQLAGLIQAFMGEPELARASYETARGLLEREVEIRPNDGRIRSSLGLVYAALGRREEAIREAKLGMELVPVSEDALRGTKRINDLAVTYRFLGEYDAALDMIEYELSIPSMTSASLLRIDPGWAPVRDLPRFKALIDSSPDTIE
jgi:TolB-like protein/Flp pilus assembly protein TadD